MRWPLLCLSLALGLGTWLGPAASAAEAAGLLLLAVIALAGALGRARPWFTASALGAAAVAIGVASAAVEQEAFDRASLNQWLDRAPEEPVRLAGRAVEDARERDDRTWALLDLASVSDGGRQRPVRGRVRVAIGGDAPRPEILQGDLVAVWARVSRPRGLWNPGASPPGEDVREDGVHGVGYSKTGLLVEVERARDTWPARVADLRNALRRRIESFVPPGPEQAVVRAMVLGDRTALDRKTAEAFRVAGTYHVLALSGAQVALVAGLLLGVLRRISVPPGPTALLVSALVILYATLVGGDVPIVRATVLAVVVLLGRALDLDSDLVNLLGLAAGVLLVARPADVSDLGFQLSFAATLGLVVLEPPARRLLPRLPWGLDVALASSIAAQAALLPLLATHFHRLAPAALVLNIAAVPLATAVLLVGAAVLAASAVPVVAHALGLAAFALAHALLRTGTIVLGVPLLDVRVPTPGAGLIVAHLAALCLLAAGRRTSVGLGLAAVTTTLFATGLPRLARDPGSLELTVLDVGQGDALVLRSPKGRIWMVDAGGSFDGRFDVGETVLGPYFWDQGILSMDGLLLTHGHPDHVGGAPFLVKSFRVGEVWEGPAPRRDRGYAVLDAALAEAHVPRRTVTRGVSCDWDGARLEVLGPPAPGGPSWTTRNDDSVVVVIQYGEVRFLLTGDIEAGGEAALPPTTATVLKVPHHGSRTSSSAAFIAATAPRVAVISVGRRSLFGHPHPEVLDRYRKAGIPVFRTDRDGAVRLATDGRTVTVRTARGGEQRVQ